MTIRNGKLIRYDIPFNHQPTTQVDAPYPLLVLFVAVAVVAGRHHNSRRVHGIGRGGHRYSRCVQYWRNNGWNLVAVSVLYSKSSVLSFVLSFLAIWREK